MSYYNQKIKEEIAKQGHLGIDARHVEAYIRLEHSTLDGLSISKFKKEISTGIQCVQIDGTKNAENLAKTFGL